MNAFSELVRGLPELLASHVEVSIVALAIGVAISMPLAVFTVRRPRLAYAVLTVAGLIQTVPGLALLALMVPLLAETGGFGIGLSSFGYAPAVIALSLYAILPVLRNAVTGLSGVDAAAVEAARGMGMSENQVLTRVQLPLAAPVIAAGIRTAAVWTIGAATLATPVGQRCLGNYIFAGLQTRNWTMVMLGVAAAALLAIVLDSALGLLEKALSDGKPRRAATIAACLLVALAATVAAPTLSRSEANDSTRTPRKSGNAAASAEAAPLGTIRVAGKTFTEQYILEDVIRGLLEAQGLRVEVVTSLGSSVVFDALRQGDVDVYVEYSGTLYVNQMKKTEPSERWRVQAEVDAWLASQHGIRSLGSMGFENAYALAVRRETAEKLGLATIDDLAPHAGALTLGADYEFLGRSEWASVKQRYGLEFRKSQSFDPTLMYEALAKREVDVITAFSSDGRIAAYDLVVLADPKAALPPYDAMVLLGPRVASSPLVACALRPLREGIDVDAMRAANWRVDRDKDKQSPPQAAAWLVEERGLKPPACAR